MKKALLQIVYLLVITFFVILSKIQANEAAKTHQLALENELRAQEQEDLALRFKQEA